MYPEQLLGGIVGISPQAGILLFLARLLDSSVLPDSPSLTISYPRIRFGRRVYLSFLFFFFSLSCISFSPRFLTEEREDGRKSQSGFDGCPTGCQLVVHGH